MGTNPAPFRVLVTGGRTYTNDTKIRDYLDYLLERIAPRDMILIAGGAKGADSLAQGWAISHRNRVLLIVEQAHWKQDGKAAGPRRNQRMLDLHHPELVVAFPGGRGTEHMKMIAAKAGIQIVEPAAGEYR